MTDQAATVEYLQTELTKLFPNTRVVVWVRKILGEPNIHVLYTHNTEQKQCVSSIWENDRGYMHFVINDERGGSFYVEHPTTHMGRVFDDGMVKFRKVRGTEQECAEKLVKWFAQHHEHILKVGPTGDKGWG